MKLIFYILPKTHLLEPLMDKLYQSGVPGATIIESEGMAHVLYNHGESILLTSLRALLENTPNKSLTIFSILPEDKVQVFRNAVVEVVGELSEAGNGIMLATECEIIK